MASKANVRKVGENEQGSAKIEEKLDTLIRLVALSIVSDEESVETRALRLQRAGMTSKAIAEVCDTTTNTVSVRLSTARRKGNARQRSRKGAKKNG